jgi:hypothetical protein
MQALTDSERLVQHSGGERVDQPRALREMQEMFRQE